MGVSEMEPQLIFLPGLGADHRLFKYQTAAFPNSIAVDWIEPKPRETLEEYAGRLADSLGPFSTPPIVCGLSLGGMVAPYLAKRLGSPALVLLCTIRKPDEFPRRYYPAWILCRYCFPLFWACQFCIQLLARFILLFRRFWRHRIDPEILQQFTETPTSRLTRLTAMMLRWAYRPGCSPDFAGKTLQVHGSRDPLLPIRLTQPDIRIERGGHLLVLSHPTEINAMIQDCVAKHPL